jgi:agmatinase
MSKSFDPNGPALEGSGIFGLPHSPDDAAFVLIPVPWDVTTSYRAGTAKGPAAILEASKQVDLFDVETGRPYARGIAMTDASPEVIEKGFDARRDAERVIEVAGAVEGDDSLIAALGRVNALGDWLNRWVGAEVERWLDRGKTVGVVGGDHSVPFGAIQAIAKRHPGVGVLHIDAHADLRDAYEGFTWSHASIMHNVATRLPDVERIVQVGIRDLSEDEHACIASSAGRIVTHFDAVTKGERFGGRSWASQCDAIVQSLPKEVYVSFDIDGLDPALCPHTGTPVPGGLSFEEASYLVGVVAKSGRSIVGFDLNEVAPGPEGDEWDANVGARMLYKLVGWAAVSAGGAPSPTIS